MANFQSCVTYVLGHEGGLTKNEADPGGVTNFGISLRFLREVSPNALKSALIYGDVTEQTIEELTVQQAEKIYYSEFWINAPFEKIMNGILGKYIFDMSVNHGLAQATRLVQQAICAAQKSKDFVKDDAIFGSKTLSAINLASFMLIPALIATRAGYMRELVAVKPNQQVFLDGWLTRCFDVSF